MEAKPQKPFSSKGGRKPLHKGKDSSGTKFGGKPAGKKPFKPYKNTENKSRPGKANGGGRKSGFSNAGKGAPGKRKLPAGGGGPPAKKRGEEKPMTDEELKKKRLQKKKELKESRQQAERKEMFDIIRQCKGVWGNLRRKKCDEEQRKKLMKQLHVLIQGKMKQVCSWKTRFLPAAELAHIINPPPPCFSALTLRVTLLSGRCSRLSNSALRDEPGGEETEGCCEVWRWSWRHQQHGSTEVEAWWLGLVLVVLIGPEDRKVIIKTMKTYMVKFATGEFGHMVLLAIFDCVDDTKLVRQAVLSEILAALPEVLGNKHGKKVLLYLLSPRDPAHMLPEIARELEQGDGNAHSKKDMATRRKELLEAVSPALLDYLCANAATMVKDKATSVTISDILASACGDLRPAMTAVAQLANQELVPGGVDGELHMAEHAAGHLVLKWLIEQDAVLAEAGREERFSRILVDTVGTETMKSWAKVNRGAMVLCSLLNSCERSVAAEVKQALRSISAELQRTKNNKGAEILLENLNK
ncbi:PREDICTED: pumilio domain-containing protein KIAA0020 homolog [Cyprinodon variegatus]|uniref:pumilio domain-containing protein KIAA0020 homolog n=1 Tax=Cyprinodon variegatus TaxID=28743 RepID=UPI000742CD6F|nr:PREDICTED: pumilio domain-containing protein KIAA0020 homolog [Cyprinodon variegatus]